MIQRKAYRRQQKLQEQLVELQNPENQIVIQTNTPIPIIEEEELQTQQQPTPVQTPNYPNPENNIIPTMDNNQFNALMHNLGNLTIAINAQTAAPARESSFAKIVDFYGDSQDPIGWLQDFESACQANNITDARKITIVGAYLKGSASTWLANKRMMTANWPTQWNPNTPGNIGDEQASFTSQFKLQFRTVEKIYEWQQQLNQRKQLPTESVEQYSSAIRELLR